MLHVHVLFVRKSSELYACTYSLFLQLYSYIYAVSCFERDTALAVQLLCVESLDVNDDAAYSPVQMHMYSYGLIKLDAHGDP